MAVKFIRGKLTIRLRTVNRFFETPPFRAKAMDKVVFTERGCVEDQPRSGLDFVNGLAFRARVHSSAKPEGSEAVGVGGASVAGGAAYRKPAPHAPACQARQDSSYPGGPLE